MTDPRDSPSPFGVLDFLAWDHAWNGHHYDFAKAERAARLMKEAGVGFVRLDFLWFDIEPQKGRFDFAKYDRLVDLLRQNNLKALGLLHYNPSWREGPWNQAPDPALYAEYLQRTVAHFKDRVKYWEVWNEPDHAEYWQPQDGLQTYAALLQQTYPLLKRIDPTCVVLLGGLSSALPKSLTQVYQQCGGAVFDRVNIHPFVNPLMPDAIGGLRYLYQATRQVMEQFGDGKKPVWLTEIGCPGMPDPKLAPEWWLGKNPTEIHQAEWVRTLYTEPLRWPGIEKIFWAFFRDTNDHFHSGTDYFGLVRNDFSKKPAFDAYKALVQRDLVL